MRLKIVMSMTLACFAAMPPLHAEKPADRTPVLFETTGATVNSGETLTVNSGETLTLNSGETLSLNCAFNQAPVPYTATIGMATFHSDGTAGGAAMGFWYGNSSTWAVVRVGAAGVDQQFGAEPKVQATGYLGGATGIKLTSSVDGLIVKAGASMWGDSSSCSAIRNGSTALVLTRQDPGKSTYVMATDFTPDGPLGAGVAASSIEGKSPGSALLNSSYRRHSEGFLLAAFNVGLAGQGSVTGPSGNQQSGPVLPFMLIHEQTSGDWTYHVDYSAANGTDGNMIWLMEL